MAGVLEHLQQQIEDLTAAIGKLSEQVKGLELGGLSRSPNALDDKSRNEKPARKSGYVNWDESHDSLKNSKFMRWIDLEMVKTLWTSRTFSIQLFQEHSITINEDTRFPEKENPGRYYNIYLNTSHPEVMCEILNIPSPSNCFTRCDSQWVAALVRNQVHTRSSFEEKYKLKWEDPIEQTLLNETEPEIIKDEGPATESPNSSEIKEADQKIADNEEDQHILGKVITYDRLISHESMPSINSGENCDSNQNPSSKSETSEVCDNTQIILTEADPATVDIMSIEPTSSQKLQDTVDVLTLNMGDDDLRVPLINDSLFKQDSSMSLTVTQGGADEAEEDLAKNEINSELKHEGEEDIKSLELLEVLKEMLDLITQSKSNNLVTELSALNLSHNKPLNLVVELFVDNYSDIMEELLKKKVNKFFQEVKSLEITAKEHFNILIHLLCEKIAEEPGLAHHFAYMCNKLSDTKEFHKILLEKCQHDFETYVLDNNQKIAEEDHHMNRRCVGIVRFIGELYNKDMVTIKIFHYCLTNLLEKSEEINLECACVLLNTSGRKIYLCDSIRLSKALKKIDELLSSETNSDNMSCRVKRMMQNTLDLSKRKWKTIPLPMTLDQFEKKGDRERLLMKMLKYRETKDYGNTRIESAAWKREERVDSKPEKIDIKPSRTKYSVETLKLAVTNENISYLKEPPTYFENIYENYSILEKFQADPTTHSDRIISYQETILSNNENKDSTTLTQDNVSQNQYKIARHLIRGFIKHSDAEKLALDIESQISRRNHAALMDILLDEALTSRHTTILSNAMFLLVETNIVTLEIFKAAVEDIFSTLRILYGHIPFKELYEKLACILAPHIENHYITLADIFVMSNNIIIVKEGHYFLGTLLVTLKERQGDAFVVTVWLDSKLSPVQWMFTEMVAKWVADYKLEFLYPHLC